MKTMRRVGAKVASLALSSALLLAVLDAHQESEKGRDVQTIDLLFQDRMRQYLLYVPAMPNGSLVLVFHGGGQVFPSESDPNIKLIKYWITHPAPSGADEFSTATYTMFTPADPKTGTCNTQ